VEATVFLNSLINKVPFAYEETGPSNLAVPSEERDKVFALNPVAPVHPSEIVYGFNVRYAEFVGYPPASLELPCLKISSLPLLN
jgi:hypothetical protein